VFRAVQTLPGIAGTDELDSRLAVRGGGPDQNLTLLDGVEIHDPFRLLGLVSAFNPELVERFDLSPGAFDARYGDRLSSLLVVQNRLGTSARDFSGVAALSTTDANAVLEGRLPGARPGSWLLSGRRTYHDLVADRFVDGELPRFGDAQARVGWEPRPGQRVVLSGLYGRERTDLVTLDPPEDYQILTRGENALASLSFTSGLGERGSSRTVASWYRFEDGLDFQGRIESDGLASNTRAGGGDLADVLFFRKVAVRDLALREELSIGAGRRHLVFSGFEAHRLSTRWTWRVEGDRSAGLANASRLPYPAGLPGSGLPDVLDSARDYTRAGAWLQDRVTASDRLTLEAGLRFDWSGANGEGFVSPRLAATFALSSRTRLRAAAGRHVQSPGYEKLFQADTFVDLTSAGRLDLRTEGSRQWVAGLERDLAPGLLARVEGYHKSFDHLIVGRLETEEERSARRASYDFPPGLEGEIPTWPRITSVPANQSDGRAYGLEVFVSRRAMSSATRLTGWLSYTCGVGEREAYGRRYPLDYDRRHAGSLAARFRASPWLELGLTARAASGFPRTPALGVLLAATPDLGDLDGDGNREELVPARDVAGRLVYAQDFGGVGNLNTARLPVFARLDFRATFRPRGPRGRWTMYLDVINVLDRENAGRINSALVPDPASSRPRVEERRVLSLPLLPSIGARFSF
jgi:hypothetical protein